MNNIITVDNEDYEIVPDEARILTEHLFTVKKNLGIPDEVGNGDLNEVVWRFIMEIFNAWRAGFPQEFREWFANLQDNLKYERPVQMAVKNGGYIPISYPYRFYQLMRVFLPHVKMSERSFTKSILARIPELRNTNYKI
jgi:hypothetical protein